MSPLTMSQCTYEPVTGSYVHWYTLLIFILNNINGKHGYRGKDIVKETQ